LTIDLPDLNYQHVKRSPVGSVNYGRTQGRIGGP